MNNSIKVLLLILFLNFRFGYAQDILTCYNQDSINLFDNNGRQGVWIVYDTNNSVILSTHHFINDTLQGYFEYYYRSGQISEKGYYKNGLLDSIVTAYWNNGKMRAEMPYTKGKLNGITTSYDENGNIVMRNKYVNGKIDTAYDFKIYNPLIYSDYLHPSYIKSYLIEKNNKYFSSMKNVFDTTYKQISKTTTYIEILRNGVLYKQTQLYNNYVYKEIYFTNSEVDKMNIYYENSDIIRFEILKRQEKNDLLMGCFTIKEYDLKGNLKYEFETYY